MNIWTCWGKTNEKFSNQEMLLTEYHPGHPSTENKFKIHMVNLSSVKHSKSWAKNIAWLIGILHTSILVTLFTGSQLDTWRRIIRLPYIYLRSLLTDNQPTKPRKGWPHQQGLRSQLWSFQTVIDVGSFKSHKNQMLRESAVRRDLWFFILFQED